MPTVSRGLIATVTDETNIKLDISEVIDFLSPTDTPLLDMVGRDSLQNPATQVKHEWLEDELKPRSGTLAAAYTAGSGTMTLTDGEEKYLYPDDLILVDDIVFRVTSGPPDDNEILVSVVGGTDAAIANGSTWRKISHAAQEGGSARDDATKVHVTKPFNYTQIFKDWVIVTGTMEVIDRYGYANERAYQEQKVLLQLAIDLEFTLIYSSRSYDEGPPRKSSLGGLFQYVFAPGVSNSWDTVVDNAAAQLTENKLNDVLEKMWEDGADPDFLLVNGNNKRVITNWATPRIRTGREERTAGASIGVYESDFSTLDIVKDRHMRPDDVIIGTRGQMGIGPLTGRQFTSRLLPSTLDGTWYEILGEYTMEVHRPTIDFGWIYDTSTTVS